MSSSFKTGKQRGRERRREGDGNGKKMRELQSNAELNEANMEQKAEKKERGKGKK